MKKILQFVLAVLFSLCLMGGTVATVSAASVKKVENLDAITAPTSVTLTWTKPSGAKGYQVQQYVKKKWKTVKTIKKAKTTTAKITGLKSKTTYKFRVRTKGKKGYSKYTTITVKTVPGKVESASAVPSLQTASVSWTKVEGVTGYKVEYSTAKKFTKKKTKTATVKKASKVKTTIKKLTPGKKYYVRVRSYINHNGTLHYGAYSNVVVFTTAYNTEVSNFAVKSTTHNSATLTWAKVADASGYQIEKKVGNNWVSVNGSVSKSSTSFVATGLAAVADTQLRIRPYRTVSGKTYYGIWKEVTATTVIGSAGTPSYNSLTTNSVNITWAAAPGATGYYVRNNGKTISTVTTNSAALKISPATTYNISVVAYNGSKQSAATATLNFTSPCVQVTGLTASVTETTITYSWSKVAGALNYEIQYRPNGGSWSTVTTTATSYTLSSLASNSTYQFNVKAVNKNGSAVQKGAASATVTATTPSGVRAVAGNSNIQLSWDTVSGATSYTVQKYNASNSSWSDVATVSGTSHTVNDTGSGNYRVVAKNAAGAVIYASGLYDLAGTNYSFVQDGSLVTFNWNGVDGATEYEIVRSTSEDWSETETYSASTHSATFFVAPGLNHNFILSAETASGGEQIFNLNICTPEINITDTSAGSKNAQLHYLVEAVNRSKFDNSCNTAISLAGSSVSEVTYLSFGIDMPGAGLALATFFGNKLKGTNYSIEDGVLKCHDASSVSKIFEIMNEGAEESDKMHQKETSTVSRSYTKHTGNTIGTLVEGDKSRWVPMEQVFEPTASGEYEAEIYNGLDSAAVAKAFDVTTVKTANGYRITAKVKKETTPNYHNGLVAGIVESLVSPSGSSDGMQVTESSIGDTTLVAEINNNCQLTSYTISTPYTSGVGVNMETVEGSDTLSISMEMKMKGQIDYVYKFTRS